MAQYGSTAYWEDRYRRDPAPFDWYQRYAGLRETFDAELRKDEPVLVVGCGNSRLSEDMVDDGYASVANVDISPVVIKAMKEKTAAKSGSLSWDVADVCTPLPFPAGRFGAVVDKGTLDSLLCGDESTAHAAKMCEHVARVLRPGGALVVISYGTPDNRLCYLESPAYKWKVAHVKIAKPVISSDAAASMGAASSGAAGGKGAAGSSTAEGGGAGAAPSSSAPQEWHHVYVCRKQA